MCSSPITISNSWQLANKYCYLIGCYDAYLTTNTVGLRPEGVVLGHDLAVLDDSAELVHDSAVDIGLLPDHGVVLVVAVVGVPEKYYPLNLSDGFIL